MHTGRERSGRTPARGALAHLLLVVVLALGVFVMHSVGHPGGSSGGGTGGAAAHVAVAAHEAGGTSSAGGHAHTTGPSAGHHADRASAAVPAPASSHDSGGGMDMTTLCVAVLGAWLLAALVRAALRRARRDLTVPPLARLLAALRPHAPPPRPPDLAALSVLRI
ncbi:hypothetical protein [Streptomyces sp. NPDC048623]|uniref:hypothetical protein n=1 Tax=Streptomyces sp. NPDC048623 TaxID=3155761 RepID=UPI00341E06F5